MPSDLSTIDLATLNVCREVVVASLRNQCCQWEQQSQDAVTNGNLSSAVMLEHWAFAAEFLATTASTEISALFAQVFDARFEVISRGKQDSVLDARTCDTRESCASVKYKMQDPADHLQELVRYQSCQIVDLVPKCNIRQHPAPEVFECFLDSTCSARSHQS